MSQDLEQFPVGIVAIGRNEGDRLKACLHSAIAQVHPPHIVYVDSGSTDDSVAWASSLGITVLSLDLSTPFTAARARNTGFTYLRHQFPDLNYIQFVDGDCQLNSTWCPTAYRVLEDQPEIAVVCGRRREIYPEHSIYNLICDMEWNTPVGEALACGGDAMIRVTALQQVNGYRESLIAGEEPELCVRLRRHDWHILRIDAEMTEHDAHITQFSQWWRRTMRAGHAFAEGAWLHGAPPERHWVRESLRSWVWGLIVPILLASLLPVSHGWSLMGGFAYLGLAAKIYRNQHSTYPWRSSALYALLCTVGKIPEAMGQLQFHWHRLQGQTSSIMEYKGTMG